MKDQRLTVTINRPVEDVFAFVINPENTPKWVDSIALEQTNEWPPKIGTIYRNQDTSGIWREIKLTAFEPNKMFVMSEQDGFHIRYTCAPINANVTELECYLWMDKGELKHLFNNEVLEKLKQAIEAEHTHENQPELSARLAEAAKQVTVGAHYMHYKQLSYTVIGIALCEDDNEPCVIYQAEYGDKVTWTRPVSSWIEEVEVNGKKIKRFTRLREPS